MIVSICVCLPECATAVVSIYLPVCVTAVVSVCVPVCVTAVVPVCLSECAIAITLIIVVLSIIKNYFDFFFIFIFFTERLRRFPRSSLFVSSSFFPPHLFSFSSFFSFLLFFLFSFSSIPFLPFLIFSLRSSIGDYQNGQAVSLEAPSRCRGRVTSSGWKIRNGQ